VSVEGFFNVTFNLLLIITKDVTKVKGHLGMWWWWRWIQFQPQTVLLYNACFGRDACHHSRNKHHNNNDFMWAFITFNFFINYILGFQFWWTYIFGLYQFQFQIKQNLLFLFLCTTNHTFSISTYDHHLLGFQNRSCFLLFMTVSIFLSHSLMLMYDLIYFLTLIFHFCLFFTTIRLLRLWVR